jgi:hypothetical protein
MYVSISIDLKYFDYKVHYFTINKSELLLDENIVRYNIQHHIFIATYENI